MKTGGMQSAAHTPKISFKAISLHGSVHDHYPCTTGVMQTDSSKLRAYTLLKKRGWVTLTHSLLRHLPQLFSLETAARLPPAAPPPPHASIDGEATSDHAAAAFKCP
jgi:hypothetical protein